MSSVDLPRPIAADSRCGHPDAAGGSSPDGTPRRPRRGRCSASRAQKRSTRLGHDALAGVKRRWTCSLRSTRFATFSFSCLWVAQLSRVMWTSCSGGALSTSRRKRPGCRPAPVPSRCPTDPRPRTSDARLHLVRFRPKLRRDPLVRHPFRRLRHDQRLLPQPNRNKARRRPPLQLLLLLLPTPFRCLHPWRCPHALAPKP